MNNTTYKKVSDFVELESTSRIGKLKVFRLSKTLRETKNIIQEKEMLMYEDKDYKFYKKSYYNKLKFKIIKKMNNHEIIKFIVVENPINHKDLSNLQNIIIQLMIDKLEEK